MDQISYEKEGLKMKMFSDRKLLLREIMALFSSKSILQLEQGHLAPIAF